LRFALLDPNKCRRPAWLRNTFPVAVILKRFATAFLVFRLDIGFGIGSRESILMNPVRNRKLRRLKAKLDALPVLEMSKLRGKPGRFAYSGLKYKPAAV
jgi:hypothetical protein